MKIMSAPETPHVVLTEMLVEPPQGLKITFGASQGKLSTSLTLSHEFLSITAS